MRAGVDVDAVVNSALDLGVTLFDTAEIYNAGRSEELLGKALGNRRHDAIIATKWGGSTKGVAITKVRHSGSRDYMYKACEGSLKRLRTDYIDLYQLHEPDPATPIEETLRACDDLIRSGNVRYIGLSNMAPWQVVEAQLTAKIMGLTAFVSCQAEFSVVSRAAAVGELQTVMQRYGLGLLPYFPLASGLLTGKYRAGEPFPADSRFSEVKGRYQKFQAADHLTIAAALEEFALSRQRTLIELAFGWLLMQPTVSSILAGATKPAQLVMNAAALNWSLSSDELAEVEHIAKTPSSSGQ